jgi:flavin-dependent dehydrogenase
MTSSHHYDVIVIGGGPAGCSSSALLAEKGHRVLLLEKSRVPRYHIGESLMPFCWFSLERLGVLPEMKKLGFVQKLSVQFVTEDGQQSRPFYFFQHSDHPSSYTWQVERSRFDEMLWKNAICKGVIARDHTKVTQAILDEAGAVIGVSASSGDGALERFYAPITIDCTGRDAFWSSKNQWRVRDPELNKIALWTYWKGAKRDSGLDAGSTTVAYLPGKGWFWYIPLTNDITSVGIVAERDYLYRDTRELNTIFRREIQENLWIKDHLSQGQCMEEYWVTGEFSYRAKHCAADGIVLAGDAFAFLDPVFSSGVFLALKSGEMAADAVDHALKLGDCSAAQFDRYGDELCSHIETMRKIVYAFYDQDFSFGKLIKVRPDLGGRLTDCLIGDMSQPFAELFEAITKIAALPSELSHGRSGARAAKLPDELVPA